LGAKRIASSAIEEKNWAPDLEDLRRRIGPKTKAIGLTSPVNPTGKVYSVKELKAIVDIAGEFGILLISDEIEGLLMFDGSEFSSAIRVAGDVPCVKLSSVSKAFGSPGWALGYMCFHDPEGKIKEFEDTVRALAYAYGHSGARLPSPIMIATAKAFEEGWWIPDIIQRVQKQREFAWKRLNEIKGISCVKSMGTFWLFPRVDAIGKTWKTTEDFVSELWEEEGVAVVPGTGFGNGGPGHFRVTNLPPIDVLGEAYDRLEKFMARHT
jgi:aspartate/methionine/tyrosine aminotransferase